jgi:hypothetical protein
MIKHRMHVFVPKKIHVNKVRTSVKYRERVKTQITPITVDLETINYFVGKGIILFTMFYCSMNWFMYKRIREKTEETKKKK